MRQELDTDPPAWGSQELHVVGASINTPSHRRVNGTWRGSAISHVIQQVRMRAERGQASKQASVEPLQGDLEEPDMRGLETTQRSLGLVAKQPPFERTTVVRKKPFYR